MITGLIYRMEWMMANDLTLITANIYKTTVQIEDDEIPEVINLKPSGNPMSMSVIDNNKDKFSVFRSKQVILEFISENSKDFSTFCDEPDNTFYVEILSDAPEFLFKGYLSVADMSQNFLPHPNIVQLTVTDHLGMLGDIPWTDDDGNIPKGKYKLSKILSQCFKKTLLNLPFKVANNLRHGSGTFTYNATFFVAANTIRVATVTDTGEFYPGMKINITGTASNNGQRGVISVSFVAGETVLTLDQNTLSEGPVSTTLSDSL